MGTKRSTEVRSTDVEVSHETVDRLRLVALRLSRSIRANSVESITPSQLFVLGDVMRHGPVTIGRLAELERVRPPSISKIVAALEDAGYVERVVDPQDRRCVRVAATAQAHEYIGQVRSAARGWLSERLGMLDPADIETIDAALPALERLLGPA